MSVKKEPSGRRSVEVEVEVPGTPEEAAELLVRADRVENAWRAAASS